MSSSSFNDSFKNNFYLTKERINIRSKLTKKINNNFIIINEGIRLFLRSNFVKSKKIVDKDDEEICRKIIDSCYNKEKKYFMVSPNNFNQFYARDFGMCCESLIHLGYKDKVKDTIIYAMEKYAGHGFITTHITPKGKCVDFPNFTPESSAYMLRSLILLDDKKLLSKYKYFFIKISEYIFEKNVDVKTGLLKQDQYFSSMKDHAKRKGVCYDNCMLGMFANDLKKIGVNTFEKYNYSFLIKKYFWKEQGFKETLNDDFLSGDANVFPYWSGLIKEKNMFKKSLKTIKQQKLDEPLALKYGYNKKQKFNFANLFVPGYEKKTVWPHLGLCFMNTLNNFGEKKELEKHLEKYKEKIIKHKTFVEVYDENGKVFKRFFYKSDRDMIWCSIYLDLKIKK